MKPTLVAVALAMSTTACSSPSPPASGAAGSGSRPGLAGVSPGIVDAEQAQKLVDAGVKVVDVRTPAEFGTGHVPGALNIPFDQIERRASEIGDPSAPVLLYCRSGRRSAVATQSLRRLGFEEIYDLRAYDLWAASEAARAGR